MDTNIKNMIFITVGIIILGSHLGLFAYNRNLFNAVLGLYMMVYIIMAVVLTYKKKDCTDDKEKNVIFYTSMFLLLIEVVVVGVSFYGITKENRNFY